jgi:hypothetical protein
MSSIKLKHSGGNSVIIAAPSSNPASDRTITVPSNADGTILTTTNPKAGNIIQAVSTTKSDSFSSSSTTSFVDVTGLSVSITPTSTSSKILVLYDLNWGTDEGHVSCRLMRDSTMIKVGDAASNRTRATGHWHDGGAQSGDQYDIVQTAGTFLDSPATTSAVTYKMMVGTPNSSNYNVVVNRSGHDSDSTWEGRTASTLTVMEVAA